MSCSALKWMTPPFGKIRVVARRTGLQVARDRDLCRMLTLQACAMGPLVALTQYHALTAVPIFFFSVVLAIWFGMNGATRELVRERKLYLRDRLAGLRPGAYLAAKAGVFLAIGLLQILALLLLLHVVAWGVGGPGAAKARACSMLWWYFVLSISYAGGLGMAFLVSAAAKSERRRSPSCRCSFFRSFY